MLMRSGTGTMSLHCVLAKFEKQNHQKKTEGPEIHKSAVEVTINRPASSEPYIKPGSRRG